MDLGIGADLAAIAVSSPALTARQADRSQIAWRRAIPPVANAPVGRSTSEFVNAEPVPLLRLAVAEQRYAELRFGYGDRTVGGDDPEDAFEIGAAGSEKIWPRRRDAEARARKRLFDLGFEPADAGRLVLDGEPAWARFVHVERERLRQAGWRIETAPDFRLTIVEPDGDWDARFVENENRWFDLDLGITIAGERGGFGSRAGAARSPGGGRSSRRKRPAFRAPAERRVRRASGRAGSNAWSARWSSSSMPIRSRRRDAFR